MDNDLFRKTYRDINERFCVYEKSILTNQCRCSQAERFCIAEREGVRCRRESAREQCIRLLELLRHESRFALKALDDTRSLPHGKAIRIQVGGLRGIYSALHPDAPIPEPIDDVYALIGRARAEFDDLEQLPYPEIIKQIAAYKGRERRRGR